MAKRNTINPINPSISTLNSTMNKYRHKLSFRGSSLSISPSDFNETFFNMLHMNPRTRHCRHICLGKYKMNRITLMNGIVG